MKKYIFTGLIGIVPFFWAFLRPQQAAFIPKDKLSEYGFFTGNLADLKPADGVVPYDLITPLFTDYAQKQRFVYVPKGTQVAYNDSFPLEFPVGSVIIKHFYYPFDERHPEKGRRIMETRVLARGEGGWQAMPYIWNDEQTDAVLEVGGGTREVTWKDIKGKKRTFTYVIPSTNQCKGCHIRGKKMSPIGPSARQLNSDYGYTEGKANQLQYWQSHGMMAGLPADMGRVPRLANWTDPAESLDRRARAWLDINCGHCHNPVGPANTSGLLLDIHNQNPTALGVLKTPVAAGRGAGDLRFDIVPGKPDESILIFRVHSADPGIMMPELGRTLIHEESVALLREWISAMK